MTMESELIQEVKALREVLEAMALSQDRGTAALEQLAKQLDSVTASGNAMLTEIVG